MVPKICSIPECGRSDRMTRGWCRMHYERWLRRGDPLGIAAKASDFKCSADSCDRPRLSRGFCQLHYKRLYKHGDPSVNLRSFTAEERFWPKVRKSDGCWEWQANVQDDGYGSFSYEGRTRGAHRVSYLLNVGPIPDGMEVDHRCHNRSCVRPDHLRPTTPKQNNENHSGASRINTTGVRGVSWAERNGKWRARVTHEGKIIQVGMFSDLAEAEAAVIAKRNELFTHNDRDRIPA